MLIIIGRKKELFIIINIVGTNKSNEIVSLFELIIFFIVSSIHF